MRPSLRPRRWHPTRSAALEEKEMDTRQQAKPVIEEGAASLVGVPGKRSILGEADLATHNRAASR